MGHSHYMRMHKGGKMVQLPCPMGILVGGQMLCLFSGTCLSKTIASHPSTSMSSSRFSSSWPGMAFLACQSPGLALVPFDPLLGMPLFSVGYLLSRSYLTPQVGLKMARAPLGWHPLPYIPSQCMVCQMGLIQHPLAYSVPQCGLGPHRSKEINPILLQS